MAQEITLLSSPDPEVREILRRLLHEERMSNKEIALEIGVDPSTVSRWLSETAPSPETKKRLLALLEKRTQTRRERYRPLISRALASFPRLSADEVKEAVEKVLDELMNNSPKMSAVKGSTGPGVLGVQDGPDERDQQSFTQKLLLVLVRLLARR